MEIVKSSKNWIILGLSTTNNNQYDTLYKEKKNVSGKLNVYSGQNYVTIDGTLDKDGINNYLIQGEFIRFSYSQSSGWIQMQGKFVLSR